MSRIIKQKKMSIIPCRDIQEFISSKFQERGARFCTTLLDYDEDSGADDDLYWQITDRIYEAEDEQGDYKKADIDDLVEKWIARNAWRKEVNAALHRRIDFQRRMGQHVPGDGASPPLTPPRLFYNGQKRKISHLKSGMRSFNRKRARLPDGSIGKRTLSSDSLYASLLSKSSLEVELIFRELQGQLLRTERIVSRTLDLCRDRDTSSVSPPSSPRVLDQTLRSPLMSQENEESQQSQKSTPSNSSDMDEDSPGTSKYWPLLLRAPVEQSQSASLFCGESPALERAGRSLDWSPTRRTTDSTSPDRRCGLTDTSRSRS